MLQRLYHIKKNHAPRITIKIMYAFTNIYHLDRLYIRGVY